MKKLVFSILLIGGITSISAQVEGKRGDAQPSQQSTIQSNGAGRMLDVTSARGGQSLDRLSPNNASSFQNNRGNNYPQASTWRNMDLQEQRETVKNMSPKERSLLMQTMKENTAIEELNVPESAQAEFKIILNDYMLKQKEIKDKFRNDKKIEKLNNEEAQQKLNESFDIGQQLLDNRKVFADKFLKILTPQQVLKLYQIEGKFRDKMLDKKYD